MLRISISNVVPPKATWHQGTTYYVLCNMGIKCTARGLDLACRTIPSNLLAVQWATGSWGPVLVSTSNRPLAPCYCPLPLQLLLALQIQPERSLHDLGLAQSPGWGLTPLLQNFSWRTVVCFWDILQKDNEQISPNSTHKIQKDPNQKGHGWLVLTL